MSGLVDVTTKQMGPPTQAPSLLQREHVTRTSTQGARLQHRLPVFELPRRLTLY